MAGSKAFDQALESAAAAAGEQAAAGGSTGQQQQQQQQQQGLDASGSLQTPFQLAAAAGIDDRSLSMGLPAAAGTTQQQQQQQQDAGACSYVCVVRAGGGLQVFALPHMQCVFEDDEAVLGHQVGVHLGSWILQGGFCWMSSKWKGRGVEGEGQGWDEVNINGLSCFSLWE
jgi:hypothetical protein